jgi:glycosyltransferase involved in cell wall biosynthesis
VGTKPLVSIIIPVYNAQETIAETLDSIIAQSYENIEIIVVDDGSTDQTAQVVSSYGSRVLYYYQNNSGGCAVPRNIGIMHSSGEFICFMDADDIMVSDRIALQVDFMERNYHVGLVFCDYRNFNEDGLYWESHFQTCPRLWPQLKDKNELLLENPCALLAQENFGIAGSFLIRRTILKFESGFESILKACEDFHFFYRLARHTSVGVINKVGMMRRLHGNNMSNNPVKMLTEGIHSRTMLRDSEQDLSTQIYLNRYIANCQSSLARYYSNNGQFLQSFWYNWQGLLGKFCWSLFRTTSWNVLRTIFIAIGLHKPKKTHNE